MPFEIPTRFCTHKSAIQLYCIALFNSRLNNYCNLCYSNQSFYGNREPQLLTKKQNEDILDASLASVLCCRLHEGFIIKVQGVVNFRLIKLFFIMTVKNCCLIVTLLLIICCKFYCLKVPSFFYLICPLPQAKQSLCRKLIDRISVDTLQDEMYG